MANSISELKKLSDEKLIADHDRIAVHTVVGTQYYLDELRDRSQTKFADRMEALTKQMWWFTLFATGATIVSLAITCWQFLKK